MSRVTVVGGGILGTISALLAAQQGHAVLLVERAPELWRGASRANEGKVHLGPVFALGHTATHDLMLRGALAFARVVERALEMRLDWEQLAGDAFDYLAMPDSLASPAELSAVYARINDRLAAAVAHSGDRYLGRSLTRAVDPTVRTDPDTGLAAFRTEERAIDPRTLGERLTAAVLAHPGITVLTGVSVTALVHRADGSVDVGCRGSETFHADYVINCAWEDQQALAPEPVERNRLNYRVKAAVIVEPDFSARTVTMVQGPYGDVVRHPTYTYASWYPVGRLTNEHGHEPSDEARKDRDGIGVRLDLADRQVVALQNLGLLPASVRIREVVGGFILGHGPADIDSVSSDLHERSEFGVHRSGPVLSPVNFKLTTAPLAAWQTARVLAELTVR